jgi:hypothetical protein
MLGKLNELHPNIRFTIEVEKENKLAFLDVLVYRAEGGSAILNVHHKPGITEYLHFKSFVPISYKRTLVRTLFTRAHKICSNGTYEHESHHITNCLKRCGYPSAFITKYSSPSTSQTTVSLAPKKSVYIKLSFKGDDVTNHISRSLRGAVQRTFPAADVLFLSKTTRLPLPPVKDSLPILSTSQCVYKYECTCGSTYVGRTERQLSVRVSEHLPKWLRNSLEKTARSAITKHIMDANCPNNQNALRIVIRQNSVTLLRGAEAVAITRLKPNLCVQKEMVLALALPW